MSADHRGIGDDPRAVRLAPMTGSAEVPEGGLRRLGERSFCVESTPEGAANAGIVVGDRALLFVDTRLTPAYGRALRELGESLAPDRAADRQLVALTHYHGDHSFGAGGFPHALFACSTWTCRALAERWQEQIRTFSEIRPDQASEFTAAELPAPCLGTGDSLELDLGGVTAVLRVVGPGHTPGDVVVEVPAEDVVYCGDLIFNGHWPLLWDADVAAWQGLLSSDLLRVGKVVPGHGPAGGPELADEMLACLELLVRHAEGTEPADPVSAPRFAGWLHPGRVGEAVGYLASEGRAAAAEPGARESGR